MGLLERIKSALGLGTSASTSQPGRAGDRPAGGSDADSGAEPTPASEVTRDEEVESKQTVVSKPASSVAEETAEESADESNDGVDVTVEHEPSTASEDAVKGTDTASSSDDDGTSTAADAVSADDGETAAEESEAESAEESTTESAEESTTESAGASVELEAVKGIGPTYADRLRAAGVEDVAALAAADPAALAEDVDIPESRLAAMVERAGTY